MNNATQNIMTDDKPRINDWRILRNRNLLAYALMRTGRVVVGSIFQQHLSKMVLIDDDQLGKAFFTNCSNPPFGESISIWSTIRSSNDLELFRPEHRIK